MRPILLDSGGERQGAEPELSMGCTHEAIHHHGEAGVLGDPAGLVGADAELQPQDLRPDRGGLAGDIGRLGGRAKDIDDVDRAGPEPCCCRYSGMRYAAFCSSAEAPTTAIVALSR